MHKPCHATLSLTSRSSLSLSRTRALKANCLHGEEDCAVLHLQLGQNQWYTIVSLSKHSPQKKGRGGRNLRHEETTKTTHTYTVICTWLQCFSYFDKNPLCGGWEWRSEWGGVWADVYLIRGPFGESRGPWLLLGPVLTTSAVQKRTELFIDQRRLYTSWYVQMPPDWDGMWILYHNLHVHTHTHTISRTHMHVHIHICTHANTK